MRLLMLFAISIIFGSCTSTQRGLHVESVDDVAIGEVSNTGFDLTCRVTASNTFKSKVAIKDAKLNIVDGGKTLARVTLNDVITFEPQANASQVVSIRMRVGQNTIFQLSETLKELQTVEVRGVIQAKKGLFQKKVKVNQTLPKESLDELIRSIEVLQNQQ